MWRVLARGNRSRPHTGGAFDCTVGPVVKLGGGRGALASFRPPKLSPLPATRSATSFWNSTRTQHAARLLKPKMRLDLGGIAKGDASDEMLAVLKKQGITRALVAGSGDIAVGDPPPGAKGWRIGIAPLELNGPSSRYVLIANAAVSTSGDSLQHVEIGGKRYSHVIDPRTGQSLTDHCSVTSSPRIARRPTASRPASA